MRSQENSQRMALKQEIHKAIKLIAVMLIQQMDIVQFSPNRESVKLLVVLKLKILVPSQP